MKGYERSPRILVVDDEEDTLLLTEATLSIRGYDIVTARGGARALTVLGDTRDSSLLPDAVLLDVMMPEVSGLEVLAHIRSTPRLGRLPVVLLTARQRDQHVIEGYQCGADYYITKPCTGDQIDYGLRIVLPRAARREQPLESPPSTPAIDPLTRHH